MGFIERLASVATNTIRSLPILVLMPHSRCNCRCVMCDIWKANQEQRELSIEFLERHLDSFRKLDVRHVALSGGEALMHSNLWTFCDLLHSIGVKISLLSTGITLHRYAKEVVTHVDELIVSLDGGRETHNIIRNLPSAYEKLEEGVRSVKRISSSFRVSSRTVIQKKNFRDFNAIVESAHSMGVEQVSFLAADVSSQAFNRAEPWSSEKKDDVALNLKEIEEWEQILRASFEGFKKEYQTGFIAESQQKLMDIGVYYRAVAGQGRFPVKKCNAPWVSTVIESTGDVLPCFFHKPYGNANSGRLEEIINSEAARSFRRQLDTGKDPICQRCVCSLHVGVTQFV